MEITGYRIISEIYNGTKNIIYKAERENDSKPVIIKLLKKEYPSPCEIKRIKQEFELIKILDDIEGVIKFYDIFNMNNGVAVIMEDINGESMINKINKINFISFLESAIRIITIIGKIHKFNIIHKDIKPQNIVINSKGEIRIIDFGIAVQIKKENQEMINLNLIEGTLPYISPEQTGRINRSVDYRSDYYSLGVSFYQILTGKLPFESKDPMEIVHSHIAKQAIPPHKLDNKIPVMLSNIIMKLMNKNAEDRYQGTYGLKSDLENCYKQLKGKGKIEEFKLGANDIPEKFQIPEKLYGRENEIDKLVEAFINAASGKKEILFCLGNPGIGKSALINEIHKPVMEKRGHFIHGKYDQFKRSMPYTGFIQAFQELSKQILIENEESLNKWKEEILNAVGNLGQAIIDIIPQIELVIGKQPPIPILPALESQNRFNLVFQNFARVFAKHDTPLVLFLDDLQWADHASLNLLEVLLGDMELNHFMFIGSYRDNEVDSNHLLSITLQKLKENNFIYKEIKLAPLLEESISKMLSETLICETNKTDELARLIFNKTAGNPFFIISFLNNLNENGYLKFNEGWEWDTKKINQSQITDNVVELLMDKIKKMQKNTFDILKTASCIRNSFYLDTLSIICGKSEDDSFNDLIPAINEGLLIKSTTNLWFVHDRVHEACYLLIDEKEKQKIHYKIGKTLLTHERFASSQDLLIFNIVTQLNKAKGLLNGDEKKELIQLNLKAGQKAKASTAYNASLDFLKSGTELLPEKSWKTDYELTFMIYLEKAEAEYLSGNYENAEKDFEYMLKYVKNKKDRSKVYGMLITYYGGVGKRELGIIIAKKALKGLGISIPKKGSILLLLKEIIMTQNAIGKKTAEDIIALSEMKDERYIYVIDIIQRAAALAYYFDGNLMSILILKGLKLSIKHGISKNTTTELAGFGLVSAVLGNPKKGYDFGKASINLAQRYNALSFLSRGLFITAAFVQHWIFSWRESVKQLELGIKYGMESGDFEYVSYCINVIILFKMFWNDNLDSFYEEMNNKYLKVIKQIKQEANIIAHIGYSTIQNLIEIKHDNTKLESEYFDEKNLLLMLKERKNLSGQGFYYTNKMLLLFLYEEYECAIELLNYRNIVNAGQIALISVPLFNFFYALSVFMTWQKLDRKRKKKYRKDIKKLEKRFEKWAADCPDNYECYLILIKAEFANIYKKYKLAEKLFDDAVSSAKKYRCMFNEALANECAAKYYLSEGMDVIAQIYMSKAKNCYQNWGAIVKVKQLEDKYSNLLKVDNSIEEQVVTSLSETFSSTTQTDSLDLQSVLKSTQSISSEIDMESLLSKMIKIVIENAGAEKGFLIMMRDNGFFIEAEGYANKNETTVLKSIPLENSEKLSSIIIEYTAKTKEIMVLNDVSNKGIFTRDKYILKNKSKSILCMPIMQKKLIMGIVYLENNLTIGAFAPKQIELLKILSGQIAISIDNAGLYEKLEDYSKNLERKVDDRTRELKMAHEKLSAQHEIMKKELKIAQKVQASFLPKKDVISQYCGLNMAGQYASMEDLGGDLYDVIKIDDNRYGFVMADVSGHGISASLMTAMAKVSFNNNMMICNTTGEICTNVNKEICNLVGEMGEHDLTAFIGILEMDTGRFEFTNAAHLPAILVRGKTKKLENLSTNDVFIGLISNTKYSSAETNLMEGDRIIFFTDGIVETMNKEGLLYDMQRLLEITARCINDTPEKYVEAVLYDVMSFSGNAPPRDDRAILCVDYKKN